MKPITSDRILQMKPSATLAMAALSRQLQAEGCQMINLSLGEPDFDTPQFIKQAAKDALDAGYTKYTPVPGIPELRQAIVEKFRRDNQLEFTADQIIISNGAKQSISNVLFSILNPGDEIILFAPYWVSYYEMVRLTGAKLILLSADVRSAYKPSPEALAEAITPRTKAILYSSPSNPTGAVFTREELEAYVRVLRKHPDILVISDEIYEYISFNPPHVSIAQFEGMQDRTAIINGFSKGFAMTGWRLGYMAGPEWLVKACSKMQSQITSGATAFGQKASVEALLQGKTSVGYMVKAFEERRNLMFDAITKIPGLKCNKPEGAFYLFPDVSHYFGKKHRNGNIENADDLTMYLLKEAHVALVSGTAFGADDCIRFSYAASTEVLREAIGRIAQALSTLK